MTTFNSQAINELSNSVAKEMEAAVEAIENKYKAQFQEIVSNFIESLNARYKRHCFILTDGMGIMSIGMYHRVTHEEIASWVGSGDGEPAYFSDGDVTPPTSSISRNLSESELSNEITSFLRQIETYTTPHHVTYGFSWEGKQSFDHVEDTYKR